MRNGAYGLATGAVVLAILLLSIAGPEDDLLAPLGTALLLAAGLVAVIGKGIDLLGYVRDGAAGRDDDQQGGR